MELFSMDWQQFGLSLQTDMVPAYKYRNIFKSSAISWWVPRLHFGQFFNLHATKVQRNVIGQDYEQTTILTYLECIYSNP